MYMTVCVTLLRSVLSRHVSGGDSPPRNPKVPPGNWRGDKIFQCWMLYWTLILCINCIGRIISLLSTVHYCRVVVVRVVCTVGLPLGGLRSGRYSLRLGDVTLWVAPDRNAARRTLRKPLLLLIQLVGARGQRHRGHPNAFRRLQNCTEFFHTLATNYKILRRINFEVANFAFITGFM